MTTKTKAKRTMSKAQVTKVIDKLLFSVVATIELTDQQQQKPIIEHTAPVEKIQAIYNFVLKNKTEEKEEANVRLIMADTGEYEIIVRQDNDKIFAVFKQGSELMYAFKPEAV